ncbi:hypothetical protein C2845_PM11G13180 [Panicum miliaceum]|uniref:DUF6598 domain-containing protein n=1 Tax=Panicum miliaceum TaxID=4540 RepID=A0A3L6RQS4_PANMI|nr:hypothetical protein C2845_PM11G13180 [Panicum miliaceum]
MADGDDSASVSCGRRDFTRGCSLRTSMVSDSVVFGGVDRLSSAVKDFKQVSGLEPFVDEAERLAREAELMKFLREKTRYREHRERRRAAEESIRDFDPKQGGEYYNRLRSIDLTRFDLDEDLILLLIFHTTAPLGPMRFTDAVYKNANDYELCEGINIFSVKIGILDADFPIYVYGTVIARDSLDQKCDW